MQTQCYISHGVHGPALPRREVPFPAPRWYGVGRGVGGNRAVIRAAQALVRAVLVTPIMVGYFFRFSVWHLRGGGCRRANAKPSIEQQNWGTSMS